MPITNDHNYFILSKPSKSYKKVGVSIATAPFRLPRWIASFVLGRSIAHIAVGPDEVKQQRIIHPIFLTDDPNEKPTIVINLLPKEKYKKAKDYFLKFNDAVTSLPVLASVKKRQLKKTDRQAQEHIDQVLESIDLLITGKSIEKHCLDHQFDWDRIHFKGMECLDEELRQYFLQKLKEKYGDEFQKNRHLNLDFFSLDTGKSSVLDSVAISKNAGPINYSTEKFIISCMPRDQNYINWIKDFHYCLQFIDATIIGFNYRGIDYSKGMIWTQDNMIKDVLAQTKRLLELGAKPENIGLEGMCLGAAVATIAAAKLHAQGIKVHLYNERSFRSIPRLITSFVLPDPDSSWINPLNYSSWLNPLNWLRVSAVGLIYITIVPLIYLSNWSLDAAEAWDTIPWDFKDYTFIYDPSLEESASLKSDDIISDSWASMASKLREKHASLVQKKDKHPLNAEQLKETEDALLKHYFKLVKPALKGPFLHSTPRRFLVQAGVSNPEKTMVEYMAHSFEQKLGT